RRADPWVHEYRRDRTHPWIGAPGVRCGPVNEVSSLLTSVRFNGLSDVRIMEKSSSRALLLLRRLDVAEREQKREIVGDLQHAAEDERQSEKGCRQERAGHRRT